MEAIRLKKGNHVTCLPSFASGPWLGFGVSRSPCLEIRNVTFIDEPARTT
jgi:hypothetical protein